ncbi:MAG: ATP-dependent Clp protease adaptor ClpS [Myxococcota bacterium]
MNRRRAHSAHAPLADPVGPEGVQPRMSPPETPSDPPPGGPPPKDKDPVDPSRERDRGLATLERKKTSRPPRFKVILYNDNYTPMEFVVQVLEKVFGKSPSAATQIMLQIHRSGMGVGGVYVLEVAETKSATVLRMAEERGYPLRSGVEKE